MIVRVRRVVGLLLYAVTLLVVLTPNLLRCLLYSRQNITDVLLNSMKAANDDRITQAEKYFSLLNDGDIYHKQLTRNDAGVVTVALTIITASRNRHLIDNYEPKYLTQSVWKFHSLLEKWRRLNLSLQIRMSICNVDGDVASYHEANTLAKFVPMFSRFKRSHASTVHILEKEKQDYVFCLNRSLDIHQEEVDYIFLVEDDALPADSLFEVLQHIVQQHVQRSYSRGEFRPKPSNIAYVKFFHPEWLLDFASFQPERLPELVAYVVILSTVLTAVHIVTSCTFSLPTPSVDVLWRRAFMLSLVVVLACGRTTMSEWRRFASPHLYSYTPSPSCCTQALLFPRTSALLAVDYLSNSACRQNFGKDSALDNMLNDLHLSAYLVQPNTFTHIGLYSTLRNHVVDPLIM